MVFVLDSNVFIQAKNLYYAFDLAPKFWEFLIHHVSDGQIGSIDRIKDELVAGNDELAAWAGTKFHHGCDSTDDDDVRRHYGHLMTWAGRGHFTPAARAEFAVKADAWLVAYAKAKKCTVVTLETPDPKARKRVFIPEACNELGVTYINTFELLRRLGVCFN